MILERIFTSMVKRPQHVRVERGIGEAIPCLSTCPRYLHNVHVRNAVCRRNKAVVLTHEDRQDRGGQTSRVKSPVSVLHPRLPIWNMEKSERLPNQSKFSDHILGSLVSQRETDKGCKSHTTIPSS